MNKIVNHCISGCFEHTILIRKLQHLKKYCRLVTYQQSILQIGNQLIKT